MVESACNAHIISCFRHADLCCHDRQMLEPKTLVRTAVYLEVVSWGDDKPQSRVCSSCVLSLVCLHQLATTLDQSFDLVNRGLLSWCLQAV